MKPAIGAAMHPISATVHEIAAAGSPFELSGPGPKTKPETATKSTASDASTIVASTSRTSIGYSLVLRFKQVVIKIKHLGLRAEPKP